MASIERRPNGRYRARYRLHPGGPQRSKHFDRKADAERFLTQIRSSLLDGSYVDPAAGRTTFGDYATSWQRIQVHRPTTTVQVDSYLRNHVLPTFGDRSLASIRPSEVQAWVRDRSEVLAPTTVETMFRIVASIFKDAVRDRLLVHNPTTGTRLPRVTRRPVVPPTLGQIDAIAAALPIRLRVLVRLAAGTGLRQGECLGLTIDRVDFLRRSITVDRQLVLVGSGPPAFGPPKTPASVRSVPLPSSVAEDVAAHLERHPTNGAGLVFTNHHGEAIRRNRLNDLWRRATADADCRSVRFHDLRHFYASLLIAHGESVKVVQARLGHASAAETLDTYAHLWPDNEERTRRAVDDLFAPRPDARRSPSREA